MSRNAAKRLPALLGVRSPWAGWRGSLTARRIRFIESQVVIPKGHGAGKLMKLAAYQKNMIEEFCAPDVRYGILSIARGNAKSTTMGALGLSELYLNEYSPNIPVVAVTLQQAKAVYGVALSMVRLNPELSGRAQTFSAIGAQRLVTPDNNGEMYPIAADVDGLQGLDPSLSLIDELGFMSIESWDALRLASGKRPNSLVVGLGTPSDDWSSALATLRGLVRDGGTIPGLKLIEYAADAGCDVHDRTQWAKANPALAAGILSEDVFEIDVATTAESTFRCYRLGQWVRGLASWLGDGGVELWDDLAEPYDFVDDAPTWGGVDVSLHSDSTAVVLGQRRPDGRLHVRARIWLPTDGLIPLDEVLEHLRRASRRYKLEAVAYDPRFFDLPARQLVDERIPMIEFPQSLERLTPAVAGTHEAIRKREISHDGTPEFAEQVLNAVPRFNESGFTLSKGKSRGRIDAAVALAMCHRIAGLAAVAPKRRMMAAWV